MELESKIFAPYRGLGLVSNNIPLILRYAKRKKMFLIETVIGNAFHTYEANKLRLIDVGNPHTHPIMCITADSFNVYTGCRKSIYAWRRTTKIIHKYSNHAEDVKIIMPFGPHLVSIDMKNVMYVWDIKNEELYLQMEFPANKFLITALLHPATYINKILLGSKQGILQLWNIRSSKLIYTFNGWDSEVTVLEQAPAQDVVAIGLENGEIYLHNLKVDQVVAKFKQDWGQITAISFRTDGVPVMVSGSSLGHIAIWDLCKKKLSSQIQKAHKKSVTGLKCFPNEPKMATSSEDNSLKIWIFDMPDGGARQLVVRDGHSAPPLMARFHGALGQTILTAGEDSTLRTFSTVLDMLNRNLGQATINKTAAKKHKYAEHLKMPPIVAFTSEATQDQPWDNIACIHRDRAVVTTWSLENQRMGDHKLKHTRFKNVQFKSCIATCLELSVCGNYVIIGYNSGHLDKYNIQSGIFKGEFSDPHIAHEDTISGIVTNGLNQIVVSGDHKGILKWWRFKSLKKISDIKLESGVSILHLHRDSGLMATALENWSINIVDIDTRSIIRKLGGHSNQITDLAFTPNSKWLISASLDRTIRTWDLPSKSCIDIFQMPLAAASISISPTGEFLATIHAGQLGIYLWANKMCFELVSLYPLPDGFIPPLLPLPSVGIDESQDVSIKIQAEKEKDDIEVEEEYQSPQQLSEDLVTLSLLPTSRWLNLLHIDTIKRRNAPVEPPQIPKSAPFFIPTVPGLDFKFGSSDQGETESSKKEESRLKSALTFESLTPFGEVLKSKDYAHALEMLMGMGPSAVDVEITSLDPATGGSEEVILNFLQMVKYSLNNKKYFEITQGYLGLFLKVHANFIIENENAQELCYKLSLYSKSSWHSLQNSLNQSLSLLSYLKNAAILNY